MSRACPGDHNSHSIEIEEGSLLASLPVFSSSDGTLRVNSHHHQAVKAVGENLRASAWAKDGIVECIEDAREERFALGVQWHPELSWGTDLLSRDVFNAFVGACVPRDGRT